MEFTIGLLPIVGDQHGEKKVSSELNRENVVLMMQSLLDNLNYDLKSILLNINITIYNYKYYY